MKSGGRRDGRSSSSSSLSPPVVSTATTVGPCDGITGAGIVMLGGERASFSTIFFFRIGENRKPARCIVPVKYRWIDMCAKVRI